MKFTLILATCIALTGCYKQAETKTQKQNEIVVEKLFTHEGCTVYRFTDYYQRYFTKCENALKSEIGSMQHCGKGCLFPDTNQTN